MTRIFCVGRNYAAHAHELGNSLPTEPVIFMKPWSAVQYLFIIENQEALQKIRIPQHLGQVHYEAELVLRLENGRINAVTLGLDLTLRDKQQQLKEKGLPWEASKAFDGSAVLGPWIELDSTEGLHFSFKLDGEEVQHGVAGQQIFKPAAVFEYISNWCQLEDNDIIMTGTPEGVGELKTGQKAELTLLTADQQQLLQLHFQIS